MSKTWWTRVTHVCVGWQDADIRNLSCVLHKQCMCTASMRALLFFPVFVSVHDCGTLKVTRVTHAIRAISICGRFVIFVRHV